MYPINVGSRLFELRKGHVRDILGLDGPLAVDRSDGILLNMIIITSERDDCDLW